MPAVTTGTGPLHIFYTSELARINTVIKIAKHDVAVILLALKGFIEVKYKFFIIIFCKSRI